MLSPIGGWCLGREVSQVLLSDSNKTDCYSVMSWETASHSLVLWRLPCHRPCAIFDKSRNYMSVVLSREERGQQGRGSVCSGTVSLCSLTTFTESFVFISTPMFQHYKYSRCSLSCIFNMAILVGGFSSTSQLSSRGLDSWSYYYCMALCMYLTTTKREYIVIGVVLNIHLKVL